ncbi:hypothetical protein FMEXI_11565 [Fusarium mexicanum]|uniref:Uncharacterized protein n=1 Tax=Fusarium mexicanum TaxID=751941 RepID=A0A8H5MN65_9HYPO|nr:hypothetical protein FMEXI_11565 [Fusarium mexicanum]
MPTSRTCRDTILDSLAKGTVDSIYADWESRESKLSATEFDFDYALALAQAQAKRIRELPPRRELDTPLREPYGEAIDLVEDPVDLGFDTKDHPEIKKVSRLGRASDIASDGPLDVSPVGSSQSPNVCSPKQGLADLEANHGLGQERQASPRGPVEVEDEK